MVTMAGLVCECGAMAGLANSSLHNKGKTSTIWRTLFGTRIENISSMVRESYQMSRLWRFLTNFSMRRRILRRASAHLHNGKMMRPIYFSMDYLLTW